MSSRTLIVEDDLPSRQVLAKILQLQGHEIDSAGTLAEARQKLRAMNPDCLILDIGLPDGSGLTLLEQLRAANSGTRIAVTTAVEEHGMLNRIHQLRPDAFFPKPVDVNALVEWVGRCAP